MTTPPKIGHNYTCLLKGVFTDYHLYSLKHYHTHILLLATRNPRDSYLITLNQLFYRLVRVRWRISATSYISQSLKSLNSKSGQQGQQGRLTPLIILKLIIHAVLWCGGHQLNTTPRKWAKNMCYMMRMLCRLLKGKRIKIIIICLF